MVGPETRIEKIVVFMKTYGHKFNVYISSDLFRLNVIRIISMIFLLYIFYDSFEENVFLLFVYCTRGFHLRKIDELSAIQIMLLFRMKYILQKIASL